MEIPCFVFFNLGILASEFRTVIIVFRMLYDSIIISASREVLWTRCSSLPDGEQQAAQVAIAMRSQSVLCIRVRLVCFGFEYLVFDAV